jgi:hypothetical protein
MNPADLERSKAREISLGMENTEKGTLRAKWKKDGEQMRQNL